MGFLHSLFGPSKEEIWAQVAERIGGEFEEGGFWGKDELHFEHRDWVITLDTYTVRRKNSSRTYTRMRAPFINPENFYFEVYQEGLFSPLGRMLGMQDVEVGYSEFDADFVIKGNSEKRLKALFDDKMLRQRLSMLPSVQFKVKEDDGWFSQKFPDGVDELYFVTGRVVRDQETLQNLFALFAITLNRLCELSSAYEGDPGWNYRDDD